LTGIPDKQKTLTVNSSPGGIRGAKEKGPVLKSSSRGGENVRSEGCKTMPNKIRESFAK